MRNILGRIWHRLNPVKPSAGYLVKFMAAIIALFALGWMIGNGWF